jgi:hypothetical protein
MLTYSTWVADTRTTAYEDREHDATLIKSKDKNFESALTEARKYVANIRSLGLASVRFPMVSIVSVVSDFVKYSRLVYV